MQALVRKLCVIMMLTTCAHAYADSFDNPDDPNMPLQTYKYPWMLGFDVDTQIMHTQNEFNNLTHNWRLGSSVYVGWRSKGAFGMEFGYNWTNDKPMNFSTVPGTNMFGATAQTTANYSCKIRVATTYLDAYWHYKIKKIAELKIGPGVGFVRQDMDYSNTLTLNGGTDPVAVAALNMYPATTMVARFNVGVQMMLTKRLGARAMFNYMTTNTIKMRQTLPGVDPHMYGNSYTFLLGVYYTITGYYDDNPGPNGEFIN